jgi:hypothetical protein
MATQTDEKITNFQALFARTRTNPENTYIVRAGRAAYYAGVVATVVFFIGALMSSGRASDNNLIAAIIAFVLGRAARYVLADE